MSMLSAQIDELRELADRYDELQVGAVKAVAMPSEMGSILREAADTIWELRDDLQRANAENDKLIVKLNAEHIVRQNVKAENAKLRELLQASLSDFRRIYDYDEQDGWRMVDAIDRMVIGMRELGIEVAG